MTNLYSVYKYLCVLLLRLAILLLLNAQVWRQCRVGTLYQYDAIHTYIRRVAAI
jgi:hypothetical protein